ncbi:MAG: AAA family ATPase [Bacteroidota bacterium]
MFKLLFLKLEDHPQLGTVEFDFVESKETHQTDKPYTSVIIGPNGTGKSFLLKTVADLFRLFNEFGQGENRNIPVSYNFQFRYLIANDVYEIVSITPLLNIRANQRRKFLYFRNRPITKPFLEYQGKLYKDIETGFEIGLHDLQFPQRVLVSSVMLNDRFTFADSDPNDFYQYLGVRKTASISSTRSFSHRTVKYLFDASKTKEFIKGLGTVLSFLGFQPFFKVRYITRYNKLFFTGNVNKSEMRKFFKEWWTSDYTKRIKESIPYSASHYKELEERNPERINKLIAYLNYVSKNESKIINKTNSSSKLLELDLFQQKDAFFSSYDQDKEYSYIEDLVKLDIIHLDRILIKKEEHSLSIDQTSSGEYHLIISLLAIYARIRDSSLILIDEPEISLHPNWQMRYASFLKEMFSNYNNCHFIMTSHSHFLISDLEGKTSSVIAISRQGELNKLCTELLLKNTYGWSAEEVLMKVFKTASDRNYYLAEKIGEILELISSGERPNVGEITERVKELRKIDFTGLSNEDPLKEVVNKLFSRI